MRPIDKLDSYEKELCESEDPADHTALLMRLLMKDNGVDPDGDGLPTPLERDPTFRATSTHAPRAAF